MNRFEQAVYDCMIPTAKLLEQTTKPLHRAMLLNFWRHVHLEGAGEFEQDRGPGHDGRPARVPGHLGRESGGHQGQGRACSRSTTASATRCCGTPTTAWRWRDWGICDEITFHQLAKGSDLRALGYDVAEADRLYHVSSRQAFIWPYDERARLAGEHLYEDKTSLRIEEVDPAEAITPARVREIHREQLAAARAERGEKFWVLDVVAA